MTSRTSGKLSHRIEDEAAGSDGNGETHGVPAGEVQVSSPSLDPHPGPKMAELPNQQPFHPQATPEMCFHCFDVLIDALEHGGSRVWTKFDQSIVPDFARQFQNQDLFLACPIFVTWETSGGGSRHFSKSKNGDKTNWQLRGCIGTLSPKPLLTAVGDYAQTSALRDGRFPPIQFSELSFLRVGVSVLVQYETCEHPYDWDIGVHGIILKLRLPGGSPSLSATFLPEVASQQGWDASQTIASLLQKAGYRGKVTEEIFERIECTRYQSSKHKVAFEEYLQYRMKMQRGKDDEATVDDPYLEAIQDQVASTNAPSWCRNM